MLSLLTKHESEHGYNAERELEDKLGVTKHLVPAGRIHEIWIFELCNILLR